MDKTAIGGIVLKLNKVQTAAYELIQADARFLYSLIDINRNAQNIKGNYMMMSQPYIGIFADGAELYNSLRNLTEQIEGTILKFSS